MNNASPLNADTPASGPSPTSAAGTSAATAGRTRFYLALAVVSLLVAGVLALFASSQPDGLERVAIDTGFANSAQDSAVADSPLADYTLAGGDSRAHSAAAGVAGVALMAAVAFGVFGLLGRRSSDADHQ